MQTSRRRAQPVLNTRNSPAVNVRAAPSARRSRRRRPRNQRSRRPLPLPPRRLPQMQRVQQGGQEIQDCAWDYLACVLNPRDGPLGCRPDIYAAPSTVYRVIAKVSTTSGIGTNATGFAMLNPLAALANNANALFTTDSTFTGTAFATSGTGVIANVFSNGVLSSVNFGATSITSQGRVIAAELRALCYTNPLNIAGYALAYETPDHSSLVSSGISSPLASAGCEARAVIPGEWLSVRWSGPLNKADRDFSSAPTTDGNPCLGIGFIGPASTSLQWLVEAYVVFEVVGSANIAPRPMKQDSSGLAWVNSKITEQGAQALQRVKDSSIWSKALSGISSGALAALSMSAAAASPAAAVAFRTVAAYGRSAALIGSGARMLL